MPCETHTTCFLFRLTLNEIHDLMEKMEKYYATVAINPPYEEADANTNCDSDVSNDVDTFDPDYLPRRILSAEVISVTTNGSPQEKEDTHDETETPSTSANPPRKRQVFDCHYNKMR